MEKEILKAFFEAVNVMIASRKIIKGRDFDISTPDKITVKLPGGERKDVTSKGHSFLFFRLSNVYMKYTQNFSNLKTMTQTKLEQYLRSHSSYIGLVNAYQFKWIEEEKSIVTSCLIFDYKTITEEFNLILETIEKIDQDSFIITKQVHITNTKSSNFCGVYTIKHYCRCDGFLGISLNDMKTLRDTLDKVIKKEEGEQS